MDIGEAKAKIRKQVLARRDGLDGRLRIEKSIDAAKSGADGLHFEPGTVISAFFPIRSEIDPRPLMDVLRLRGARLCLPVVIDKTTIIFRELVRGGELADTGFGTRGPDASATVLDPQIMIMPLAVFDRLGGRIGYGAGHYDRAISRLVARNIKPTLIGMAFDCQEYDLVPQAPHDVAMGAVISESGFREFDIG